MKKDMKNKNQRKRGWRERAGDERERGEREASGGEGEKGGREGRV